MNRNQVLRVLKAIALSGNTVVCRRAAQQPSYEILTLFDKVMILCKGQIAFFGAIKQAVRWFGELGYHPPENSNPAEFLRKCSFVHHSPSSLLPPPPPLPQKPTTCNLLSCMQRRLWSFRESLSGTGTRKKEKNQGFIPLKNSSPSLKIQVTIRICWQRLLRSTPRRCVNDNVC